MTKSAVNHPPTPVVEAANAAVPSDEECAEILAKYEIETGTHEENTKRGAPTKKSARDYQSHHVLQDAATNSLIDRGAALCVMLCNSERDTEHQRSTRNQNERMNNKGGSGTQPAKNFGELKKLSKEDLVGSLQNGERKIPEEDAKKIADCLVAQAEKEVKRAAKEEGIEVNDATPVDPPGGCFASHTLIWTDDETAIRADEILAGQCIVGRYARLPVVRIDTCVNDLVEIRIGHAWVSVAPFHRVHLDDGSFRCAGKLRLGDLVATASGPRPIAEVVMNGKSEKIFSVGVGEAFECKIGEVGIWVELPDTGPSISRNELVTPYGEFARPYLLQSTQCRN